MRGAAGGGSCLRRGRSKIIDYRAIEHLARAGFVVVGCGGGGIPVIEDADGTLRGVEAVIDKDLASSLLARSIGADLFVLATGVERVALGFQHAASALARPAEPYRSEAIPRRR